jgi:hypothetical protein
MNGVGMRCIYIYPTILTITANINKNHLFLIILDEKYNSNCKSINAQMNQSGGLITNEPLTVYNPNTSKIQE